MLADNEIGSDGVIALAAMPQLRNLKVLDLRINRITARGARALAHSEQPGHLGELCLGKNAIRARAWAALELRFGGALH